MSEEELLVVMPVNLSDLIVSKDPKEPRACIGDGQNRKKNKSSQVCPLPAIRQQLNSL